MTDGSTIESDYEWDVFLAHASPDKPYCRELTDALEGVGLRVFLDERSLDAASEWDKDIPEAQARSRITLIYVSSQTPKAWFQRAEIVRAISQRRFGSRRHQIVPIWGDGHRKPYGTEMLVGIEPGPGVAHVVDQVQRVLARSGSR